MIKFNAAVQELDKMLELQEEACKYLGVMLSMSQNYLREHEERMRNKAKRYSSVVASRALWGYDRYEVVRTLWKVVAVPGLTFANGVLCTAAHTRTHLETRQWEVGRVLLGAKWCVLNTAVQGDMGWPSFEAREARGKLFFKRRLSEMEGHRWARQTYKYLHFRSRNTRWTRRTRA